MAYKGAKPGRWGVGSQPWDPLPMMQEYVDERALRDDLHPVTVRRIRSALTYFATFLRDNGVTTTKEISRDHLIAFCAWLPEEKGDCHNRYINQLLRDVSNWSAWLARKGIIAYNPWGDARYPTLDRIPDKAIRTEPIPLEDLGRLFDYHREQSRHMNPFMWHRQDAILGMLYGWGLTISEMTKLTMLQVDPDLDIVTVGGKRRPKNLQKEDRPYRIKRLKILPYGENMKAILTNWMKAREKYALADFNNLIITSRGTPIAVGTIRNMLYQLGDEVGVNLTSRSVRKTLTDHLLLGTDLPTEDVAKVLGVGSKAINLHLGKGPQWVSKGQVHKEMDQFLDRLAFKRT